MVSPLPAAVGVAVIHHHCWPYRLIVAMMMMAVCCSMFFFTTVSAGFYSSSSNTFEIPTSSPSSSSSRSSSSSYDAATVIMDDDDDDTTNKQEEAEESPYLIILDGGSTGSRLHVFEFVESTTANESSDDDDESDDDSDAGTTTTVLMMECHRRGSARTDSPLSIFGRSQNEIAAGVAMNATALVLHFNSVFQYAATVIPAEWHASTRVLYQATAGMRLLAEDEQEAVYDAMYQGWMHDPDFAFKHALRRTDIATLTGDLEGYYGAVAANYLEGIVNANLELTVVSTSAAEPEQEQEQHHHHHGPIGALDMGGSSTQIVFLPPSSQDVSSATTTTQQQQFADSTSSHTLDAESDMQSCFAVYDENEGEYTQSSCEPPPSSQQQQVLQGRDFFSTSYLSYGVDQFRERLWTTWVQDHIEQQQQQQLDDDNDSEDNQACDSKVIANPCSFVGYQQEWLGHTLIGTGDAEACADQVRLLIPHPHQKTPITTMDDDDNEQEQRRVVGGIAHPPVRGKFFAMSLYFFTLDSLRELSSSSRNPSAAAHHAALNKSWPTPSIQELVDALDGLCSRSWHGDLYDIQDSAHLYTRAQVLPHRCLESVYMVTLLKDGFGFAPESRDITFTFLVDGNEVEWTLGMALVMQQEKRRRKASGSSSGTDTTTMAKSATSAPSVESSTARTSEFSNRMDKSNNTWKEDQHGRSSSTSSSSASPICSPSETEDLAALTAS